ncbi:L-threonylcarbamoyladenylate synthase [Aurantibacter aestuarii]|uniref:L-threonylcarbamoyladenylate synthase n=1 Tax=Aurantibacter aestuarii TaxID=1266046 RepID=A0A2T1N9V9_9FLAO|nr:L-threonylcarbamoyladenylate synthase [Aurantibacter aestuarii]PSG88661.1 threonylcarbamoyl-AMP synthase [Aurantibacter aestuarii]
MISKAKTILLNQKTLLYPTDTVYGIGCDATNETAVKKIYTLKQRDDSKALICLVNDVAMLKKYIKHVPNEALELLKNVIKPTTIIYNQPIGLASNLISQDNSIAIRIVTQGFAHELITAFGKPIVSTSANISGEATPKTFDEISEQILKGVDYVVNLSVNQNNSPSQILKLELDGTITVIRA